MGLNLCYGYECDGAKDVEEFRKLCRLDDPTEWFKLGINFKET